MESNSKYSVDYLRGVLLLGHEEKMWGNTENSSKDELMTHLVCLVRF